MQRRFYSDTSYIAISVLQYTNVDSPAEKAYNELKQLRRRRRAMLISERIYNYLEEKGISQIEFAKRTGISQSTISDWRRKDTNPSADKILIICQVLGISPYELLAGTENKKLKEYRQPEYMLIDRRSRAYDLVETYEALDGAAKERLEGYLRVLSDKKK